jgi:iron complex outermembrane receptor protein
VNWKPFADDALLYANVSRGFKSGSFPIVSAQLSSQLSPAKQEKLTAYEVGFKAPLADRTLQLNGAAFYYHYTDKQLRGRIQTFFGQLEKLVNIPESEIRGGEMELMWYPADSFTLTSTASYIHSRIENNPDGSPYLAFPQRTHGLVPVSGEAFPYTPEWTFAVDAEYRWQITAGLEAFLGAAATYQSRTKSGLESAAPDDPLDVGESATESYNDPLLAIPSYLLLDLRAGIERSDGRWSLAVWGKNVTDEYYRVNVLKTQDTMLRYSGEPATYGVTLGVNL